MHRSKIEWVLNPDNKTLGWVWNPITGCLNHVNGICNGGNFPCYAYKLANGRLRARYLVGGIFSTSLSLHERYPNCTLDPFYPRFWPERLEQPFDIKGSAGIFPCDMSDLFGIGIPHEWTEAVMNVIKIADRHRFYLLTKQPQNLPQWSPFPPNVYLGVTATNQEAFDNAIYWLGYHIEAKIKFISIEPFLQPIHTSPVLLYNFSKKENLVNQVIIGTQTKPTIYPEIEWVEEIETSAKKAGIAIFEKDNLKPLLKRELIQELPR